MQLAEAIATSTALCTDTLLGLKQSGACGEKSSGGKDGGSGVDGSGGGPPAIDGGAHDPPDVCVHYLSCATAVEPADAAALIAAYGPDGSCWQSTQAVADSCINACTVGLGQWATQNRACGCRNDADCGGTTPACEPTSGLCVACYSDAYCKAPGAPHCDPKQDICVGCTDGSQCELGVCNPDSTCLMVTSLQLAPANPAVKIGGLELFLVTGSFNDGSVQTLNNKVTWTAADIAPAMGVASIGTSGLATGNHAGQATISASYAGVTASTTLTVLPPLTSLVIAPANASVQLGATQLFKATGNFSDGTMRDVTASAGWKVGDIAPAVGVASVVTAGQIIGNHAGQATVTVSYLGMSASTVLTVTGGFVPQASGTTNNLYGVFGTDADNVWVVGASGTILKWDGKSFAAQTSGTMYDLNGVWGTDVNNVWAVGRAGTILKWDGTSFTAQPSGTSEALNSVWGSAADNIWAVGESGTILKWDGTSFTAQPSGTSETLNSVWGSAANNVWAVGNFILLTWNGTAWVHESGTFDFNTYTAVWGSDANNVFVVNSSGQTEKWNGSAWSTLPSSLVGAALSGIWGTSASNLWVAGSAGLIQNWNGTAWATQPCGVATTLGNVWALDTNNVFIVGTSGTILKWLP